MGLHVENLASAPGWTVSEVLCSSGPHDRPFEEQHPAVCIAAVMQGSFHYRTTQGSAVFVPGAVLLGNHQSCFECGHDHSTGDRCLSFMFDPAYFETILSSISGVRPAKFRLASLPPLMSLTRLFADAQLASLEKDQVWLEQLALELAVTASNLVADRAPSPAEPSHRDQRRIAAVLRRIQTDAAMPLSIGEMARDATMSPYYFLRTFRHVVGTTPHQFILRTRLQDAAVQLRRSALPVLDIALDAGFADLSTFHRRFHRFMGVTPKAYRRQFQSGTRTQPSIVAAPRSPHGCF